MADINCSECNGTLSDLAVSCPHCGYKLSEEIGYIKNPYQGK